MSTDPRFCHHYEHEHVFSNEGTHCANCSKPLTILETLDPNERWTITNDGNGNITITHP